MYLPLPCRFEKKYFICPKNKVSIVQLILRSVVVCINGLNVTFRARWFHRVFPTERRDCDCPGFPPPLGSRRLRSRNCLYLTSIPLSFNKPAAENIKYSILQHGGVCLLLMERAGCIFNVIMQVYWQGSLAKIRERMIMH